MTITGPKVRDLTDRQRSLQVIVDSDPVYEFVLASLVTGGESSEYQSADPIMSALRDADDADLIADLERLGSTGEVALTLLGLAHDLPTPRTPAALVARIREIDPAELRRGFMRCIGIKPSRGHDEATIERAAAGDVDALDELVDSLSHECGSRQLLATEPDEMREFVAAAIERLAAAVEPVVEGWQPVRDRDAANTRAMARTMTPERLVERVTNGITFEMQPQVSGVLLIPSVAIRPWVVISEHGTLRVFAYSVSDQTLRADPDSPPAFLVDTFKALGDENRLRILGVLAAGDMGLKDIAARLDIAKSTTHHHLRILRSAGLIRVIVGADDKRYSLRRDATRESGRLLESFLTERAAATDLTTTQAEETQ